MATIEERLRSAMISLPDLIPPVVEGYTPSFVPFIVSGSQVHISGRLAKRDDEILAGKVGGDLWLEEGKRASPEVSR